MATPVNSTYVTETIPVLQEMNSRFYTIIKDSYFSNMVPYIIKDSSGKTQTSLTKRWGTQTLVSVPAGVQRGFFHWKDTNLFLVVIDRDCYVYSSITYALSATLTNIVAAGTTEVGMCEFITSTGTKSIIITDGTVLSEISTGLAVTVAGAGFPTPHLPTPVYYDGYLLLVKANTADCYNSNLDFPLVFTAGDFISAEMAPDVITGITTINNHFVLFGSKAIEYFYDAGNPTGTPFARNDVFVKLNGYYGGIAKYGNDVYIVSIPDSGSPDVYVLRDFKLQSVGNNAIRKFLGFYGVLVNYTGSIIALNGNTFYVLVRESSNVTYMLDISTGIWGVLDYKNTGSFPIMRADSAISPFYTTYFTLINSPNIYAFIESDPYTDTDVNVTATIVTQKSDFGTNNQKYMSGLELKADRTGGQVNISWTDNDYQTYSTPRTISLDQEQPDIRQLGRFRQRAFKITESSSSACKIDELRVSINMGIT